MLNFEQLWVDLLFYLTIAKYFENLQLGHAKCRGLKKLNYQVLFIFALVSIVRRVEWNTVLYIKFTGVN